jgi:hypothetical protein
VRRLLLSCVILACVFPWVESLKAQPRPIALGKPLLQTEAYFTDISTVVRTRSGDLWVADPGGEELVRVSGKTGAYEVVGRSGEGPAEYRAPQMVFAATADTVLLFDSRLFRLNVYAPDGRFVRSVSMGGVGRTVSFVSGDDRGHLSGVAIDMASASTTANGVVVRFAMSSGKIDTVVRIAGKSLVPLPADPKRPGMRAFGFVPFADVDAFVSLANGGYVLARAASGRVEWYDATGRRVHDAIFPGSRQPVTAELLASVQPAPVRAMAPKTMPLFDEYGVVRSTGNRVWIRANGPAGQPSVWYGFVRGQSTPLAVQLPKGARIVGASEPYLLVARRTDDGLQQVEVHRVP